MDRRRAEIALSYSIRLGLLADNLRSKFSLDLSAPSPFPMLAFQSILIEVIRSSQR
jgi:hypothetical protein